MRAIETVLTNETLEYRFSEFIERLADTHMGEDASMGEIFRVAQREYGRCQSKVFIDAETGPQHIGWFFISRQRYEDCAETYLRGAWVTVGEHVPAVPEHLRY